MTACSSAVAFEVVCFDDECEHTEEMSDKIGFFD